MHTERLIALRDFVAKQPQYSFDMAVVNDEETGKRCMLGFANVLFPETRRVSICNFFELDFNQMYFLCAASWANTDNTISAALQRINWLLDGKDVRTYVAPSGVAFYTMYIATHAAELN